MLLKFRGCLSNVNAKLNVEKDSESKNKKPYDMFCQGHDLKFGPPKKQFRAVLKKDK